MSDAQVLFFDSPMLDSDEFDKEQYFGFACPKRKDHRCEGLAIRGRVSGRPSWEWNGQRVTPTFAPSINCQGGCIWHGFIEKGRCVDTSKQDEPEPI